MTIEEIRKGAPDGANNYYMDSGVVIYCIYYHFGFGGAKEFRDSVWMDSFMDYLKLKPL